MPIITQNQPILNLSGVQASTAGVSSSNLQLKNKAATVKPQRTDS